MLGEYNQMAIAEFTVIYLTVKLIGIFFAVVGIDSLGNFGILA